MPNRYLVKNKLPNQSSPTLQVFTKKDKKNESVRLTVQRSCQSALEHYFHVYLSNNGSFKHVRQLTSCGSWGWVKYVARAIRHARPLYSAQYVRYARSGSAPDSCMQIEIARGSFTE